MPSSLPTSSQRQSSEDSSTPSPLHESRSINSTSSSAQDDQYSQSFEDSVEPRPRSFDRSQSNPENLTAAVSINLSLKLNYSITCLSSKPLLP